MWLIGVCLVFTKLVWFHGSAVDLTLTQESLGGSCVLVNTTNLYRHISPFLCGIVQFSVQWDSSGP